MRRAGLAGAAGGGVGKSALQRSQLASTMQGELAGQVTEQRIAHVREQVELFKKHLEEFALKYRSQINKDPQFRHHFVRMAKSIGVDPLSSSKGWLAENLGIGLGTFYADLAVQVAHACVETRPVNGGLISMPELLRRVNAMRSSKAGNVNEEDVRRALDKLSALGGGYKEVVVGSARYIQSVPELLSGDSTAALSAITAAPEQYATIASLARTTGWSADRSERALRKLLTEGVAWLDAAHGQRAGAGAEAGSGPGAASAEDRYYVPSLSLGAAVS